MVTLVMNAEPVMGDIGGVLQITKTPAIRGIANLASGGYDRHDAYVALALHL